MFFKLCLWLGVSWQTDIAGFYGIIKNFISPEETINAIFYLVITFFYSMTVAEMAYFPPDGKWFLWPINSCNT